MIVYDCLIIGGGIAGLQAAIQLGRYKHKILVLDANDGRSVLCRSYHNILGWPEGVSGEQLRSLGMKHAQAYDVTFMQDVATHIKRHTDFIQTTTRTGTKLQAKTVLLATGITDHIPHIKNLKPCLGISVYVCPDCDGYEVSGRKTVVLGAGNTGAEMALTLTYWTHDITYINHNKEEINLAVLRKLKSKGIVYIENKAIEIDTTSASFIQGIWLEGGDYIHAERAFVAFGGNKVHTELAVQLGIELDENKHIMVNPRTKETSVADVWAAGDIVSHSEQVTIAMGDGSQAAIWIHKKLMNINEQ
jgi:thioredoxin reductase (NADPH)